MLGFSSRVNRFVNPADASEPSPMPAPKERARLAPAEAVEDENEGTFDFTDFDFMDDDDELVPAAPKKNTAPPVVYEDDLGDEVLYAPPTPPTPLSSRAQSPHRADPWGLPPRPAFSPPPPPATAYPHSAAPSIWGDDIEARGAWFLPPTPSPLPHFMHATPSDAFAPPPGVDVAKLPSAPSHPPSHEAPPGFEPVYA